MYIYIYIYIYLVVSLYICLYIYWAHGPLSVPARCCQLVFAHWLPGPPRTGFQVLRSGLLRWPSCTHRLPGHPSQPAAVTVLRALAFGPAITSSPLYNVASHSRSLLATFGYLFDFGSFGIHSSSIFHHFGIVFPST